MKTLINENHFLKAVEYVSQHHFSQPYSLSPIMERWFNQLAMIELDNNKIIHLTGKTALQFLDIYLDGVKVPIADIALIEKFHTKKSTREEERKKITEEIARLKQLPLPIITETEQQLNVLKEDLAAFDANKLKAKNLYHAILEKDATGKQRGQAVLNEPALETAYKSKIKRIIHRPNHGLTHSARTGYLITAIHQQRKEFNCHFKNLNDTELEKLQLMMLFSVVGRRDETGFNEAGTHKLSSSTYESYRADSGREYLKYVRQQASHLYKNNLDNLYRDAIIVELMGYAGIDNYLSKKNYPPQLLIDYIIEKEQLKGRHISRDNALRLISNNSYSLDKLFQGSQNRALADNKLRMMSDSHGLDIARCYPLYPHEKGGSKYIGLFYNWLYKADLMTFSKRPDSAKLTSFFNFMRNNFDALAQTGQRTTFGLISNEAFAEQKVQILSDITAISDRFKSSFNHTELLKEANLIEEEINGILGLQPSVDDEELLGKYEQYLLLKTIADGLTASPPLKPTEQMFKFHVVEQGKPHQVNHHKNAVHLVAALQAIKPVGQLDNTLDAPKIAAVTHDRENNKVTLTFDKLHEANNFLSLYQIAFDTKAFPLLNGENKFIANNDGQFFIEANRKNYKQLVEDHRLEFSQVTVPKAIKREVSLIDDNGMVDVLNLVNQSRALIRLVSTSALKTAETFPDYDYLLKNLENPATERYTPGFKEFDKFPLTPNKYFDPRSGHCYDRTRVNVKHPNLCHQEPVTAPIKFADKIADGWIMAAPGGDKNTIFTKKMAHTLLPPHGRVIPYAGYTGQQQNYFPIGIISDIKEVDLKDERYVWAQNMVTYTKFWIRDMSIYTNKIFTNLHATFNNEKTLQRDQKNRPLLDKHKLKKQTQFSSAHSLIQYLESRKNKLLDSLGTKHFHPTKENIADFKALLQQERQEYLNFSNIDQPSAKMINDIYDTLDERLDQEKARNHPKYAISVRELIKQQRENNETAHHNEILAGNTKRAVRGFYATKNELFDRLNLAFHSMRIKHLYHYDIPLLVLSTTQSPYHYTEAMIKQDLKDAYHLLRTNQFPYDNSKYPSYEVDEHHEIKKTPDGNFVVKKDNHGNTIQIVKNRTYQDQLLVDLFKVGIPELTHINQLQQGQLDEKNLDSTLEQSIDMIMNQMDIVGGLTREKNLMNSIFSTPDNHEARKKFFLRAAALGHQSIVTDILLREDFIPEKTLLLRAQQFAGQNNHQHLKKYLENVLLEKTAALLPTHSIQFKNNDNLSEKELFDEYNHCLDQVFGAIRVYQSEKLVSPKTVRHIDNLLKKALLNPASNSVKNEQSLWQFAELLMNNPLCIDNFIHILINDKEVKLDQLIDAEQRLGPEILNNALSIIKTDGWESANNYLLMVELNVGIKNQTDAETYLKTTDTGARAALLQGHHIVHLHQRCKRFLDEIAAQSMGSTDHETHDFYQAMSQVIENGKDNYILLDMTLKKLQKVHEAVTSPEMMAIKKQIARLEKQRNIFFKSTSSVEKAHQIGEAVSAVPLLKRVDIFSNKDNFAVRKALATHRYANKKPFIGDNQIDESKAAKSYKEMYNKFKP